MNQDNTKNSSQADNSLTGGFDDGMGFDEFWDNAQRPKEDAKASADSLFGDLNASLNNLDLGLGEDSDKSDDLGASFDGLNMHNLFGDATDDSDKDLGNLKVDKDSEFKADSAVNTGNIRSIFAPDENTDDEETKSFSSLVGASLLSEGDDDEDKTVCQGRDLLANLDLTDDPDDHTRKLDISPDLSELRAQVSSIKESEKKSPSSISNSALQSGISGAAADLFADALDDKSEEKGSGEDLDNDATKTFAREDKPKGSDASMSALADVLSTLKDSEADDKKNKKREKETNSAIQDLTGAMSEPKVNLKKEDAEEASEEDVNAEEADSKEGSEEIQLSERARMGKVYPEGPVIESDHELGHNILYSEEECAEEKAPAKPIQKLFFAAIAVMLVLLGVCVYILLAPAPKHIVAYSQQGSFQLNTSLYEHIYVSADGYRGAMCSNERGVIFDADRKIVSEFWPTLTGCKEIRVSDDGTNVWYLDNRDDLYEVRLEADTAFNPHRIITLVDKVTEGFDIIGGKVVYFAVNENSQTVLRRLSIQNNLPADEVLPDDALACDGMTRNHYAYVSESALHIIRGEEHMVASLDAAKLGCSRASILSCVTDREDNWSILCQDSVRQGHGKSASSPIPFEDTAIRSGAKNYKLLRNDEGTDLVTTDKWVHIDSRNNAVTHEFAQALDGSFSAVLIDDEEMPLIGLNGGSLFRVSADGQLSQDPYLEGTSQTGTLFVNGGKTAAIFTEAAADNGISTAITLWDLAAGKPGVSVSFNGPVAQVNVSPSGRYGFVVTGNLVSWISWETGAVIGTTNANRPIADVSWSNTEANILVRYSDGSYDLLSSGEKVVNVRSYSSDVILAFATNDLMWRYEGGEFVAERINDGTTSVVYRKMTEELTEGFKFSSMSMVDRTNLLALWGESGLLLVDITAGKATRMIEQPVSWVTPDRLGENLATSAGIIDIDTGKVTALPAELANVKLHWAGFDKYLQPSNKSELIDMESASMVRIPLQASKFSVVGANAGFHPASNIVLNRRNSVNTLEKMTQKGGMQTLAAFSSNGQSWCWSTANGAIQGEGNTCVAFAKPAKDGAPQQPAAIVASNAAIPGYMTGAMAAAELPAVSSVAMPFVEDTEITIDTVPSESYLVISLPDGIEGSLPAAFIPEGDSLLQTPFNVKMKNDHRTFNLMFIAGGYESRIVSVRPAYNKISMRVPLLLEGAGDISLTWKDLDEPESPLELSEDLDIEFKSMIHERREIIKICLSIEPESPFTLTVDDDNSLAVASPESVADCLKSMIDEMQELRDKGALPDFPEYGKIGVDIVIP